MIARELNLAGIPCPSRKSLLGEDEIEAAKAKKKTALTRVFQSGIIKLVSAILLANICTRARNKPFVKIDAELPAVSRQRYRFF